MSELYLAEVVVLAPLRCDFSSTLVRDAVHRLAQVGKLKDVARLKKEPDAWTADLVASLAAEPLAKAKKTLPPSSKLLGLQVAIKELVLHLAHPSDSPAPAGTRVVLRVRSIHPDAGMPDHRDPSGKLNTFVLRLLADATPKNEARTRYPTLLETGLRVRREDLWAFELGKGKKVPPLSPMPGQFFESTLEVVTDAAVLAHLRPEGRWSSVAFVG